MKAGDIIGGRFVIADGVPLAVQGREGCEDVRCTRRGDTGQCIGWHCGTCGAPCSSQGHKCPARDES